MNFHSAPWSDVLEVLATTGDLALDLHDDVPEGTFSFLSKKTYSLQEAVGLVNRQLIRRNCIALIDDDCLVVWNMKQRLPSTMVPMVKPEEISQYGSFQVLTTSFKITNGDLELVARDIDSLIDPYPFCSIIALQSVKRIQVTALAASLLRVKALVDEAEGNPTAVAAVDTKPESKPQAQANRVPVTKSPFSRNSGVLGQLRRSHVADTLNLTQEQRQLLKNLQDSATPNFRALIAELRDAGGDDRIAIRARYASETQRLQSVADGKAVEVLTPAQRKDLLALLVREQGLSVVMMPFVGNQISLTADQRTAMAELPRTDLAKGLERILTSDQKAALKR